MKGRPVEAWHDHQQSRMDDRASAFAALQAAFQRSETFEALGQTPRGSTLQPILRQTHGSLVALVGDRAYKVKKPVDLEFLDYSTPLQRRDACIAEVALNRRLAADVYLGVAPVISFPDGTLRLGPVLAPSDTPDPGAPYDAGHVADYAVVMRRLPESDTLAARLAAHNLDAGMLHLVAGRIAAFHANTASGPEIAGDGSVEALWALWRETFSQMEPYVGALFDVSAFTHVRQASRNFLNERARLFERRVVADRIRDGHGDLRLEHIYVSDTPDGWDYLNDAAPASWERIQIVDCIEFSARYRYADVAADIAFPAMELDAGGRLDLGRVLADAYSEASGDEHLRELLPFYLCYRACVRAKVNALLAGRPEIGATQRAQAEHMARDLFALADEYASALQPQTLTLVGGLSGSGKSVLTQRLRQTLGWPAISSDSIRKQRAQMPVERPQADAFQQGLYSQEWTRRVYSELAHRAREHLEEGHSVLADATFTRQNDRLAMMRLATDLGVCAHFLECICPPDVALERLKARWKRRMIAQASAERTQANTGETDGVDDGLTASDARPEIYKQQRQYWQDFDADVESTLAHTALVTDRTLPVVAEAALTVLCGSQRICWLENVTQ